LVGVQRPTHFSAFVLVALPNLKHRLVNRLLPDKLIQPVDLVVALLDDLIQSVDFGVGVDDVVANQRPRQHFLFA
jgi:hypothetical protein